MGNVKVKLKFSTQRFYKYLTHISLIKFIPIMPITYPNIIHIVHIVYPYLSHLVAISYLYLTHILLITYP